MTVTGESDKEIKSMAFTPCSFLLLFRKYFFMTTSVNGKLTSLKIEACSLGTDTSLPLGRFLFSINIARDGYIPLAIAGWNLGQRAIGDRIHFTGIELSTLNNTVSFYGTVTESITISKNVSVEILYIKKS
jgi:hypothetical protein